MDVNPRDLNTVTAFGAALTQLKQRSGRSLSQLSSATASAGGGLSRSTLNGYFKGRHLPQQGVGGEFRLLLAELGVRDNAELDAWWATVERLRGGNSAPDRPGNPYPGLRAFDTSDAGRFFGRSALTDRLHARLDDRGDCPITVVGPSGAGKTSLLRAGLVPRLREHDRTSIVLTPGKRPWHTLVTGLGLDPNADLGELASATRDPNAPDVLIVDQFEEFFASELGEDDREYFLAAIGALSRTMPVILGLRADFYGHALRYPELASALQRSQVVVGPMLEADLREAITEPAQMAGFRVDAGLVELLLREVAPGTATDLDAAHEQGALPLLCHALRATFDAVADAGQDTTLTVRAYQDTGGIRHAVADTAETAYTALDTRGRQLARQLFLRLVHVEDGTADTRRIVDRDELFGARPDDEVEELDDVLDTLVTHRLLTAHNASVQICHEALLAAWPRLRGWLDDGRAGRRVHRRLTHAAREWRNNGRSSDDLYQGRTLAAAAAWAAEDGADDLNPLEREFLTASIANRDAEQASERKRVRRRSQLTSAAVALLVLVAATTVYALRSRQLADEQAREALSRNIAAKVTRLRETDPGLAAQLAAVAYRHEPTVDARSALLDSAVQPIPTRQRGPGGDTALIATTPTRTAMAGADGTIVLTRTGETEVRGPTVRLHGSPIALALSDDAALLAAVTEDGLTQVWDVRNPAAIRELPPLPGPRGTGGSVAFAPDNRMLAVGGGGGRIWLWPLTPTGEPAGEVQLPTSPEAVTSLAFAPDGRALVAGSDDRSVHRFDLSDPTRPRALPPLTEPDGQVYSVAISPDGRTVAAGTARDRSVFLWDVSDPENARLVRRLTGPASWVNYIDFSPDGQRLIAGSSDSKLWVWQVATAELLGTLPHSGVVTTALYVDDQILMTLAEDGVARTWRTAGAVLDKFDDTIYGVAFGPAGRLLAVGPSTEDNAIHLADVTSLAAPRRIGVPLISGPGASELTGPLVVSQDGTILVAGTSAGEVLIWDLSTPERALPMVYRQLRTESTVATLDIDAAGRRLVVSNQDGTTSLFDISRPRRTRLLSTMRVSDDAINDIRFSPDGRTVAIGSDDGNAYLYGLGGRKLRRLTTIDVGGATSIAFDADSRTLAIGSAADDNVHLWDITDRTKPTRIGSPLDGPVGDPYQIAFHTGRNKLSVASVDGTVWSWDVSDQRDPRLLATLTAPTDAVTSVAYTRQGTRLAGGSRDGSVYIWPTDPEATIRQICKVSGDAITATEWNQFLPDTPYDPPCRNGVPR